MMQNSRWESWLNISSTLAVLLGVMLVIFQLRQNADLLELQILKQDTDGYIANALETLPENFDEILYKSMETPEDLTGPEIISLDKYFWGRQVARWRGLYDLAQRGLLEESAWKRAIREEAAIFSYPFGREWWIGIKNWETTLPDDLIALVDQEIDSPANEPQRDYFENLRRRALARHENSQ